jgi:hypothetical protein
MPACYNGSKLDYLSDPERVLNPCELESPGSRRGRNAEFAGGRVL